MNESAPPPPRKASADTKEKCSLLVGFARDQFFLKRKGHFSLAFCPPSIRAGGGTNADSVLRKLFFGERISQNTRLIFFEFGSRKRRRRGLGRNPPLAPLVSFGEFRAGVSASLCNLVYFFWSTWIIALYSLPANRCYSCNLTRFFVKFNNRIFNSPAFIDVQCFSK